MPGKARKRWTVLIYMVADDPQGGELLDRQAVKEMDQITKATLSVKNREDIHVAVQVDFRTLPGVWRRSIGESTFVRPESNAVDPATLPPPPATGRTSTEITSVLGDGVPASSGEGMPANTFPVDGPRGLACDSFGNLWTAAAK